MKTAPKNNGGKNNWRVWALLQQ